jgi:hypothetical protein
MSVHAMGETAMRSMIFGAVMAGVAAGSVLSIAPNAAIAQERGTVTVTYAADLQERFDETYGEREKQTLEQAIDRRISPLLQRGYSVELEILDARPNRPTFKELGDRSGLSFQSFGLGGASMRAIVRRPDGQASAPISYSWYEHDISQTVYQSTWGDAQTAIDRFSRRLNAQVQD